MCKPDIEDLNIKYDELESGRAQMMDILDNGVKAYDDYICAMQTRTIGYDDAVALSVIRQDAVDKLREWLNHHTELANGDDATVFAPLENTMIAELLFNLRFLLYIHEKCGARKAGWVAKCNEYIVDVIEHSAALSG